MSATDQAHTVIGAGIAALATKEGRATLRRIAEDAFDELSRGRLTPAELVSTTDVSPRTGLVEPGVLWLTFAADYPRGYSR